MLSVCCVDAVLKEGKCLAKRQMKVERLFLWKQSRNSNNFEIFTVTEVEITTIQ